MKTGQTNKNNKFLIVICTWQGHYYIVFFSTLDFSYFKNEKLGKLKVLNLGMGTSTGREQNAVFCKTHLP